MARTAYLVLSQPPADVSPEEFDRWYHVHVDQILQVPGFVSARRHRLRFVKSNSGVVPPFAYSCLYEIDGPFDRAWAGLRAAVDGGRMDFPDWYGDMDAAGWECLPTTTEEAT